MDRADIKALNTSHDVVKARFFTADQFRRRNGLDSHTGLCAGLVQVWWSCVRFGRDGLETVRNARPQVVADVRLRQARSYYWSEFPSETDMNSAATGEFMRLKYPGQTLANIHALCRAHHAESLFEFDLMSQHSAQIVLRHAFTSLTPSDFDVLATNTQEGLRLMVLRYHAPNRKSGRAGHRIAFVREPADRIRFFDPNCGEIVFLGMKPFGRWLLDYWNLSAYSMYVADPVPGVPPVRVFQFDSTFWTPTLPGPDASSAADPSIRTSSPYS